MPRSDFVSAAEVYRILPPATARRLHDACKRFGDRPIDVLVDALELHLEADDPVMFDVTAEDLVRVAP